MEETTRRRFEELKTHLNIQTRELANFSREYYSRHPRSRTAGPRLAMKTKKHRSKKVEGSSIRRPANPQKVEQDLE